MRTIGQNVDAALAAGLSEEIITAMSRFRWISCVSARSLAEMAGTRDGGHLYSPDIDLVLDGTIQAGSDRLRITVRLFDMRAGGKVIWAYCFDRNLTDTIADVIVLQDDVAAAIVAQVEPAVQIREAERAGLPDSRTASPRDLVLQAVAAIYRLERPSFLAAGAMLEAAIRAEPGHADALAWLAHWNYFLVDQGWAEAPDVTTARAGALAEAAVSSNPNDARSLTLAGHVRGFLMRRPAEAEVLHDRAISLNPNLAIAWCLAGLSRSYAGDQDGAISRMCEAIDLSPLDPHFFFFQAAIVTPLMLRGQHREAATAGRAAIELNPGFSSAFRGYLAALGKLGREREAADVLSRLLKLEPGFTVQDAMRRSPLNRSEDVACYADGLRRAGLPEG
jgi:TolB-like protein